MTNTSKKAEMLAAIGQQTGLSRNTIRELMQRGWRFERTIDQEDRFVRTINFPRGSVPKGRV